MREGEDKGRGGPWRSKGEIGTGGDREVVRGGR